MTSLPSPSATAASGRASKRALASSVSTTCCSCRRCPRSRSPAWWARPTRPSSCSPTDPAFESTSPNKFFDGLAAGKPVVVNVDGWLRRLVEENAAGLYVPADDRRPSPPRWSRSPTSPISPRRMGANARRLAEREFDRDVMAGRLATALESVVAGSPAGATKPAATAARGAFR